MRSGSRIVLPVLLASTLAGAAFAQETAASGEPAVETPPAPVTVTAAPSKDEVTVGETFSIDLKADGPPGTTYRFAAGASEDDIELRTPEPEADAPAPDPATHRYEAEVYALGEVEIPPIPVRYRLPDGADGEVDTEPIVLKVGTLLPRDAEEQKLADIRGPEPVGIGRAFWLATIAGLLLVAGLVTWLMRRRRKESAAQAIPVPETPPDVEALAALTALAASGLVEARAFREFYIRLTAIAKRYLERRLDAPVLEMTTTETVAFLRDRAHGSDLLRVMRDLAQAADHIKFARGQGLAEAAEAHLAAVRALVPALEARLRPPAPETPEEGKAA
ncbi:MAG: hypothetical protein LJF30_18815 [Acidobacteria bacterium]|nr:hypothetical protein [Acidobacteriota bacterium]